MSEPQVDASPRSASRPRDPWVRFACPHCGKRNKADAMSAGGNAACARCGQVLRVPPTVPRPPVMRSVDVPNESPPEEPLVMSGLHQLSAHVVERDPSPAIRKSFRLPTWVMVVLHAGLTLGTIAAIWLLHARGYFAGFNAR